MTTRKRAYTVSSIQWHVAAVVGMTLKCQRVAELEAELEVAKRRLEHYVDLVESNKTYVQCSLCGESWFSDDLTHCDGRCDRDLCDGCADRLLDLARPAISPFCAVCEYEYDENPWWCQDCAKEELVRCMLPGCQNSLCKFCAHAAETCPNHQ